MLRLVFNSKLFALFVMMIVFFYNTQSIFSKTFNFKTKLYSLTVELVTDNLNHPWGLQFLTNGSALITERAGKLKLIEQNGQVKIVAGTP